MGMNRRRHSVPRRGPRTVPLINRPCAKALHPHAPVARPRQAGYQRPCSDPSDLRMLTARVGRGPAISVSRGGTSTPHPPPPRPARPGSPPSAHVSSVSEADAPRESGRDPPGQARPHRRAGLGGGSPDPRNDEGRAKDVGETARCRRGQADTRRANSARQGPQGATSCGAPARELR